MSVPATERGPRGEVALALEAMATRFELVLYGDDPVRLRAAGEAALGEIARLDRQLSFYRPESDVSWINARAGDGAVRVDAELFALLDKCRALSAATDGAFDITVGPLMRAWGFVGGAGRLPEPDALERAHAAVGSAYLLLDPSASTIRFGRPGMSIDFGAAGKGYAIDVAIGVLREHGAAHALLHGGTSSIHALGSRPDGGPWRIAWTGAPDAAPITVDLRDGALAASGIGGKSFVAAGQEYGHVMDPRTGRTTACARATTVTGPGSLECDALSTALLVLGPSWLPTLGACFPGYQGTVV